jgi:hypothetical protein
MHTGISCPPSSSASPKWALERPHTACLFNWFIPPVIVIGEKLKSGKEEEYLLIDTVLFSQKAIRKKVDKETPWKAPVTRQQWSHW